MEKRHSASILAFFFGILLCAGLLFAVNWALGLFKKEARYHTSHSPGYFYVDETGSWRPTPNAQHEAWNRAPRRNNDTIYRVTYTIDEHSRRVTPTANPALRDKHLLFFGCSFTYGVGVRDNQTIPYYAAAAATEFKPYNYGFEGHSPTQMLAKLETKDVPLEVAEKEGYLIFTFMDDHVARSIGSMRLIAGWGSTAPYYEWTPDNLLIRKGTFETGKPWLTGFYKLLGNSNIVRHFNADLPVRKTNKHFEYTARIIQEAKVLYQRQFPNGKFVAVIYPNTPYGDQMNHFLKKMNVATIHDSSLMDPKDLKYVLAKEDPHPSPYAYQILADKIVTDLGIATV